VSWVSTIARRFGYLPQSQVRAAFQAAALSRLTNDWTTSTLSADAQARNDLRTLIARTRDLRDNYDYAKAFVRMAKTNVLGHAGIHFKNKAKDPDRVQGNKLVPGALDVFANKAIEDAKWEWSKKENCTVTGELSLCDVQKIVLESCVTDGGHLVRKVRGFDNPFRFALQLFEIDHVDFDLNVPRTARGTEIRMGIEFNEWGRRLNYYLFKRNPNDSYYGLESWGQRHVVLPASEIIHPFVKYRSRQTHGIPWMVTPAERMKMLKGYEEAELVASRVAAAKMGFFQTKGDAEYKGDEDSAGNKLMDAEPGAFEQIPAGLELAKWDPQHPNSTYPSVVKAWLRGVAAGLGTSYHTLANDMEAVNFASGMIGLADERDNWTNIQHWFIEDFEEPVHTAWLEMALLSGVLDPLPMSKFDKFNAPSFSGRRWDFVNPDVEVSALEKRLRLRLTSITRELAKQNIDRDELFQEIEDDTREMEKRRITPVEVLEAMANVEKAEAQAVAATQPKPQPNQVAA
jgi:lambda family phage portal protein